MKEKPPKTVRISRLERKEVPRFFDAVLVLGNVPDFVVGKDQPRLSFDGKTRVVAAGELYRLGLTSRLILSGGHTLGEKYPSEAAIMADYLMKHFNVPRESIVLEDESTDSVENVVNLKKLLDKEKIEGRLAILTSSYHMRRVMQIMESEGLEAEPVIAEDALLERSQHYRSIVEKYLSSGIMKAKKVKEAILRGLLVVDPKGELPRKVTKRLRS